MPTFNPRVNVTLSPSLDSLVGQLAALERVSKSMVLRELLEAAEPSLRHAVALMQAAQGASVKARDRVARDMQSSIDLANAASALSFQVASNNARDMVAEAEAIRGRRPPRRGSAAIAPGRATAAARSKPARPGPPSSNRGVKS
jgi:hypothetical protein